MPFMSVVEALVSAGHSAPSGDNPQPWKFTWDSHHLAMAYDFPRNQGLTFPPGNPASLLAIGGAIENVVQAADSLDLPVKVDLLESSQASLGQYANITCPDKSVDASNLNQHPLVHRHCNRFPFKKEQIPANCNQQLLSLVEGDARIAVYNHPETSADIAQLIRAASEIRFQTKEVHEWLGRSLRFTKEDVKKADGLDIRTLGLPPGGKLFLKFISEWKRMSALNRVGAYKLLASIDAQLIKQAPALIAIIAPKGVSGFLDAGRLLTRAWIYLNSQGVAVHPYYVITDQLTRLREGGIPEALMGQAESIELQSSKFFELSGQETLCMLLRVGCPTKQAPRSLRLPLERVFTDLT